MKNVLITGKDSYIGYSLDKWLKEAFTYKIDCLDMRDIFWKKKDFSKYDAIFHVAGIAHIKETKNNQMLFYKTNRDLAIETAKKAKAEGVRQFIFLSTMSVYGINNGVIDKHSQERPLSAYGNSKIQAEEAIYKLNSKKFFVAILRPPMVYGKGCKGNYPKLAKLARNFPIFPLIDNNRSMIYIDNLSEFVKKVIDNMSSGIFFPQNREYVNTSEMVRIIAECHEKKIYFTRFFNSFIKSKKHNVLNKVFGDLFYEMSMSEHNFKYRVCDFISSVKETESPVIH
jgi:UDP-glucose 4-epimerase